MFITSQVVVRKGKIAMNTASKCGQLFLMMLWQKKDKDEWRMRWLSKSWRHGSDLLFAIEATHLGDNPARMNC